MCNLSWLGPLASCPSLVVQPISAPRAYFIWSPVPVFPPHTMLFVAVCSFLCISPHSSSEFQVRLLCPLHLSQFTPSRCLDDSRESFESIEQSLLLCFGAQFHSSREQQLQGKSCSVLRWNMFSLGRNLKEFSC